MSGPYRTATFAQLRAGTYEIAHREEHCHRCGTFGYCVIRWNLIRPESPRKTALCPVCAEREQSTEDSERRRE